MTTNPGTVASSLQSIARPLSTDEQALIAWAGWPSQLFEDPKRQPRLVACVDAFVRELLLGNHLYDVVVFPNGLDALGLGELEALPPWLWTALDAETEAAGRAGAPTVLGFLRRLESDVLEQHKAALEFVDALGVQREALPRPYPFCLWDANLPAPAGSEALPEAWRNLRQRIAAAEALVAEGEVDASGLYACEMRRLRECKAGAEARRWGAGSATKSLQLRHARDAVGELARWTLYWNCYDDGLFVGGRGSGKGLHVDQVLWSNVGKHWRGLKLLVVWPPGKVSADVVAEFGDAQFRPPLSAKHALALGRAAKVVLLRPGDIFLMSGGVAHATLTVSECLSVTAYESLVTLNPQNIAHFLRTGSSCGPGAVSRGVMEADNLWELWQATGKRMGVLWQDAKAMNDYVGASVGPPDLLRELKFACLSTARKLAVHSGISRHLPSDCASASSSMSSALTSDSVQRGARSRSRSRADPKPNTSSSSRSSSTSSRSCSVNA